MPCNLVIPISGSECIGDSRVKINNNFDSLCTAINSLSGSILTPITTPTIVSYFDTTTRRLSSYVRSSSITDEQLAPNAVITSKLSAQAVTTDKIALSAVTAEKMSGGQTGSAPVYGCRAWVNFDCTRNSSGVTDSLNTDRFIRASGNVSSVLKVSSGNYQIIFNIPMPNTDYCFTGTSNENNAVTAFDETAVPELSSFRMDMSKPTVGNVNPSRVTLAVFV